jgi:serine O-acetyltransferase
MDYLLFYLLGDFWGIRSKYYSSKSGLKKRIFKFLFKFFNYKNNSSIGINTTFNARPIFPHGAKSIFISGDAVIGKGCIIYQQVTIGSNTLPGSASMGAPTIGDNCLIGAGAKIIGSVTIGDNCRIGANAIVVENVPSNCVVVGTKARIIQKDNLINHYYYRNGDHWIAEGSVEKEIVTDDYRVSEFDRYDKKRNI